MSTVHAENLSASRLQLIRKRRRRTLTALAAEVGTDTRTLSAWTRGERGPDDDAMQNLARALNVPTLFLTGPELDEIPEARVSFRAKAKLTARQRDAALSAGRIAFLLNEWIERDFRLPEADVPELPGHRPEDAAEIVRARWGIGHSAISNMVHLLEAHGVRVFSLAADCAEVDAFSLRWNGTPGVLLNTGKSGERGRFDAAHELGHLVLHTAAEIPHGVEAERAADRFAAALLMPATNVLAADHRGVDVQRVLRDKRRWKVSAMALAHRLHELGQLTDEDYRTTCVHLARLGYRTGEPGGIPRETSQLLGKVFQAVRGETRGTARIADELNLPLGEISEHVFGLVPVAVPGGQRSSPPQRDHLRLVEPGERAPVSAEDGSEAGCATDADVLAQLLREGREQDGSAPHSG